MDTEGKPSVAILLATYNGSRLVDAQIHSLKRNSVPFTLHWLDDHSTDNTRDVVYTAALASGIRLKEWHQPRHLGIPHVYFRLLECVDADIYLFSSQDDIWEPGRIDAAVENLRPDIDVSAFCFCDHWYFNDAKPESLRRRVEFGPRGEVERFLAESRLFLFALGCAPTPTQAFTRPLREIFLRHAETAHAYAPYEDWWMFDIAMVSGMVRALSGPKVLWRRHEQSFCATTLTPKGGNWFSKQLQTYQLFRRAAARHAEGLILASPTLPAGPKLDRMLEAARLVVSINRRQSISRVYRLARRFSASAVWAAWLTALCLCSDAGPD